MQQSHMCVCYDGVVCSVPAALQCCSRVAVVEVGSDVLLEWVAVVDCTAL